MLPQVLPVLLLLVLESGSSNRKRWLGTEDCCCIGTKEDEVGEILVPKALAVEAVFIGKEQCLEIGKDETASSGHAQQSRISRIEMHEFTRT